MRSSFGQLCFAMPVALVALAACTPNWAPHNTDAGVEAVESDGDGGEEDAAQVGSDASEMAEEAGAPDGRDGATPEPELDGGEDAGGQESVVPDAGDGGVEAGCGSGYRAKGSTCEDIDECFEGSDACHMTATCENNAGGYDCTCPLGYSGGTSAGFACAPRIAVGAPGGVPGSSCVLLMDGAVQCWGENEAGQLGDGSQTKRVIPTRVREIADAVLISAGGRSACAVLHDTSVRCWGENANGQLGDGTTMNRATPVRVLDLDGVVGVSVGLSHTCAVLRSGNVKCWGKNKSGQLGTGSSADASISTPALVKGIREAVSASAYGAQTCVTLRNGAAKCWGEGLLGDASVASSLTPIDVKIPASAIAITVGPFHSCSLHADRHINCWGSPGLGGNGVGGGDADPRPVLRTSATAIGIGLYSTCILRTDGSLAWWDAGLTPATVDGMPKVVAMAASGKDVCEIHAEGTVSCWQLVNAKLTLPVVVQGIDLW